MSTSGGTSPVTSSNAAADCPLSTRDQTRNLVLYGVNVRTWRKAEP